MGEVDEADDPVDHGIAYSDQPVQSAQGDTVDDLLAEKLEVHRLPPYMRLTPSVPNRVYLTRTGWKVKVIPPSSEGMALPSLNEIPGAQEGAK
jgi:hypothetical protein